MATRSEIQTGLEITANVEGMQNIQQLTTSIEQAGSETANLSKEAEKLANQWKEVQSNQELINHYKSLKSALSENKQEIKHTEQAMRQLNTMMANGIVTSEQEEYKKLEKQLQKLNEERRNLTAEHLATGMSNSANKALNDFNLAASQFGKNAEQIQILFNAALAKMDNPQAVEQLKQSLNKVGKEAKLTEEQLKRLDEAAVKGATAAKTAYDKLGDSIKAATDTTKIQATAQAAAEAMKRGELSADQYQQVLKQLNEKTEELKKNSEQAGEKAAAGHQKAANAAMKETAAKKEAAAANAHVAKETEKATQATEQHGEAMAKSGKKASQFGQVISAVWAKTRTGIDAINRAMINGAAVVTGKWKAYVDAMWSMHDNAVAIADKLNAANESGADTAQLLARAEAIAASNAKKLDQTTLNNLNRAIDAARQKMQALAEDAKKTREDLQAELADLTGDGHASEKLNQQRKLIELRKKQEAASKTGNRSAASDYDEAIILQQHIFAEQERKRQEEAVQRQREEDERIAEEQRRQQEQLEEQRRRSEEDERKRQEAEQKQKQVQLIDNAISAVPQVDLSSLDVNKVIAALNDRDEKLVKRIKKDLIEQLEGAVKRNT